MPPKKPLSKKPSKRPQPPKSNPPQHQDKDPIDLTPVPIALQQLLLNTIKSALLPNTSSSSSSSSSSQKEGKQGRGEIDLKPHIQTLKSHLYNRDFESAFADASDELLRAYALRWSAARALGYVGVFRGVARVVLGLDGNGHRHEDDGLRVVCIGGGAGAEIVALATAWRALFYDVGLEASSKGVGRGNGKGVDEGVGNMSMSMSREMDRPGLSITAVDIADWSTVVERLDATIRDPDVPALRSCSAPLLPVPVPVPVPGPESNPSQDTAAERATAGGEKKFTVNFQRCDVLNIPDSDFNALFGNQDKSPNLVTLMFTLNELFSTSMAKATSFLLRLSDSLRPGTVLLVVDSPGSYSTLKLSGADGTKKERQYPMKFLLDHALLSVAKGRWEKVFSQDSRWWRREAARLSYDVGEGAGLEDMRFQVHVYRRVDG